MTFKTNLPVMVFIDFLICLPSKKKNKPIKPLKQPKSLVYLNKTSYFNPKTIVQAHFRIFKYKSYLFEPIFFIPDNQDPIFAGYDYNLHVIFIYVW